MIWISPNEKTEKENIWDVVFGMVYAMVIVFTYLGY
jgi:hypothetical protein